MAQAGSTAQAIFSLAANTLPALHTYPPQYAGNGTPIDYQTPDLAPVANGLHKPWFTEEFGWTQSVGDATRAGYYHWLYQEQDQYGSDGAMFWNLGPESSGGSHDVNPGRPRRGPRWSRGRAHAHGRQGVRGSTGSVVVQPNAGYPVRNDHSEARRETHVRCASRCRSPTS